MGLWFIVEYYYIITYYIPSWGRDIAEKMFSFLEVLGFPPKQEDLKFEDLYKLSS